MINCFIDYSVPPLLEFIKFINIRTRYVYIYTMSDYHILRPLFLMLKTIIYLV